MIALSNSRARAYRSLGIGLSNSLPENHGQVRLANDTLIGQTSYIEELTTYGIGYGSMTANRLKTLRDFIAPARPSKSRVIRLTQYDESEPWAGVDYNKVKRSPLADFAEVRQRSSGNFGGAIASIDAHRQKRLILTAQHYLTTLPRTPPCRFDAVLLDAADNIEWVKNAFEA